MAWTWWSQLSWLARRPRTHLPRPAKRRKPLHLQLRQFEPRWLFNAGAWLGQNPLLGGAGAGMNSDPWLTPQIAILNPRNAVNGQSVTASLTSAGSFSLSDTGSYSSFSASLVGANASDSMTFTETGSAGFTLTESGTLANGSYTVTSYQLNQSLTAFWHFHETTVGGALVTDMSGTVTLQKMDRPSKFPPVQVEILAATFSTRILWD